MSMQNYGNPPARNPSRAAGGTIPAKVSVPLPGVGATQSSQGGAKKPGAPAGFGSALINGKV